MSQSLSGNRRPRVNESHRIISIMFVMAGVFAIVAVVWAAMIAIYGGSWWGPLHAFLAGAVLSAISGATQMFTITWSTTSAPPRWISSTQRWLLGLGVALVLVGITTANQPAVWLGGTAVVLSLVILAFALVAIIRRSLLRRFDQSMRFYLLAIACGVIGVTLGVLIGTGSVTPSAYGSMRSVHLHLNLVGLVGFTIIGTLPTLLPTFVPHKAVSGRELPFAWRLSVVSAVAIVGGLVGPLSLVGFGTIGVGTAALIVITGIIVRLERKGTKGGLPYASVAAGVAWLATWAIVDGILLIGGTGLPRFSPWTVAAVVAGVGQVLIGSMTYLIPVLIGPPVGANLGRMRRAPAVPLIAVNLAGVLLVIGIPLAALAAGVVWAIDFVRRLATLRRPERSVRPS